MESIGLDSATDWMAGVNELRAHHPPPAWMDNPAIGYVHLTAMDGLWIGSTGQDKSNQGNGTAKMAVFSSLSSSLIFFLELFMFCFLQIVCPSSIQPLFTRMCFVQGNMKLTRWPDSKNSIVYWYGCNGVLCGDRFMETLFSLCPNADNCRSHNKIYLIIHFEVAIPVQFSLHRNCWCQVVYTYNTVYCTEYILSVFRFSINQTKAINAWIAVKKPEVNHVRWVINLKERLVSCVILFLNQGVE